jgi:LacI family transcriptional regulator
MSDVAREADVSLMTVSRVVNNKDGIRAETRQKVLEVVERLGYRPSNLARGLATKKTGTIGLVVPDNANPYFSEVARGVEHLAYTNGYTVFLCNTEENITREFDVLRLLDEYHVDGLILCSPRLEDADLHEAIARQPATVLVNRPLPNSQVASIMIDAQLGGQLIARHLIENGHTKIGIIAGPRTSLSGQDRLTSYVQTIREAGIEQPDERTLHCSPTIQGGTSAARQLLQTHPELTALICFNDLVAVGALQACNQIGRYVPKSVAITGFDDIPMSAFVTPSLTTCHVHRHELGRQAMQLLLDLMAGELDEANIVLKPHLVVRDSSSKQIRL